MVKQLKCYQKRTSMTNLHLFNTDNFESIEERLKNKMVGAILHSFRNANQFLEVEFASDDFEEIIFFMECDISCSDDSIVKIVNNLKLFDKDVSNICFFIPANNKKVKDVVYNPKKLSIIFDNDYSIYFDLDSNDYGEPLSISFRKNKDYKEYEFIDLWK